MSHVGRRYDLVRGGKPLRVVVVGQESGLPKDPDSPWGRRVSLEARYHQLHGITGHGPQRPPPCQRVRHGGWDGAGAGAARQWGVEIVTELGAQRVLDVGCGTGTFALMLSDRGVDIVGLDPAGTSLDVARGKPGAERVRWVHGDASALPGDLDSMVDLAVMTANVAQAIVDEQDWARTLAVVRRCLRPSGYLVFETRRPARRGWEEWTREQSETGARKWSIRHWVQLPEVDLPLVRFEAVRVFGDQVLASTSTLRFRSEEEIAVSLAASGYVVREVREAPDRPGREFVFVAQRAED